MSGAIELAAGICARYQLADLDSFVESCRAFERESTLNIAVFGRFKAGKSSFLNHLLGEALLPVGATPVTSIVTSIEYGAGETMTVYFLDGRAESIPRPRIGEYVDESENPGNAKQVSAVDIQTPAMEPYRGMRFVDTPGLDSVFAHNTEAASGWLPNTGIALVAVSVDPPLSRQDIDLIRKLNLYTPHISVILTKFDMLAEPERDRVVSFVRDQLQRSCSDLPVFPYSIRPGFESLRDNLNRTLLDPSRAQAAGQRAAILRYKTEALLAQCHTYLSVALEAARRADSEREQLRRKILGEKRSLDDARLPLHLITRHAANLRSRFEEILHSDAEPVTRTLRDALDREFPSWTSSLAAAMDHFDDWLSAGLKREMGSLSGQHSPEFSEPISGACRQLTHALQDFRNRLAEQTLATLGVALRTTQLDLPAKDVPPPDIRVGRIFDRNWELLSPLIPMAIFKPVVHRHFQNKLADAVATNLSRLAAQWEELVSAQLLRLEKESLAQLDALLFTIHQLLATAQPDTSRIVADLDRIRAAHHPSDNGHGGEPWPFEIIRLE